MTDAQREPFRDENGNKIVFNAMRTVYGKNRNQHYELVECVLASTYRALTDRLAEVVEGLRRINTLAVHNRTDAFDPTRWLIEIAEESQHLSAQLEAHRGGGLDG